MGEMWMGLWIGMLIAAFFGGLVVVAALYDYYDRKKRGQVSKRWKYVLAVLIGVMLLLPLLSGVVLWLFSLLR